MRFRWIIAVAVAVLALPASAVAGGWATVELSSTPGDDLRPGDPWVVEMKILQHGRTPLEGVKPTVTVSESGSGASKSFAASPTEVSGVYQARVVFPRAGEWRYVVNDGFSQEFTYPPVRIAGSNAAEAPAAGSSDDGFPWTPLLAALAVGLLGGAVAVAVRRRRGGEGGPRPIEG